MDQDKALVVFEDKKIRRIWHNNAWYFSVVDVVQALTESPNPRQDKSSKLNLEIK